MGKPEAKFWSTVLRPRLVRECLALKVPGHFERVENGVAVGTPDVDYCVGGRQGKIELKYATRVPTRPGTPVLGRGKGLRRSQVVWVTKRLRTGGTCWLCVGAPKRAWLVNLAGMTVAQLKAVELWSVADLEARAVPGPTLVEYLLKIEGS